MDNEATQSRTVFPLRLAYPFAIEHGLEQDADAIRTMKIEWESSYTSSVRRGYLIELFAANGILDEFLKESWPEGLTSWGQSRLRRWRAIKDRYQGFLSGRQNTVDADESAAEDQFAAEADLRDFLAKNLDRVEEGLRLYEKDDVRGVEFEIDDGRIDLLAVDKNDRLVVIELKVSRGRNKTLGQLLYYMGWVDAKLGRGPCRGIIIAREISEDLKLAVQWTTGVSLFSYTLSVTVDKVV
jgi:hypothetical protein